MVSALRTKIYDFRDRADTPARLACNYDLIRPCLNGVGVVSHRQLPAVSRGNSADKYRCKSALNAPANISGLPASQLSL